MECADCNTRDGCGSSRLGCMRLLLAAVDGSNGGSSGSNGGSLHAAAVGATAGVMGVAGVCGSEVAMANGAVAYACVVVLWSVLTATPGVVAALAALVA